MIKPCMFFQNLLINGKQYWRNQMQLIFEDWSEGWWEGVSQIWEILIFPSRVTQNTWMSSCSTGKIIYIIFLSLLFLRGSCTVVNPKS